MQRAVLFDLDETLSDRTVSVRRMMDVFADRFGDGVTRSWLPRQPVA